MQRKLRTVTILAGIGAAITLVLLVLAAGTGSIVLSLIAGTTGLLLLAGLSITVFRVSERVSVLAKQLSSRLDKTEEMRAQVKALDTDRRDTQDQLAGVHRQLKVLRNRVPAGYLQPLQSEVREDKKFVQALLRISFESAIQLKRDPRSVLTSAQAEELFQDYLSRNEFLQLTPLIMSFNV